MHASARVRIAIALTAAITCASTVAPASARAEEQQAPHGLPLTPPPLESANPRYERTPTAQPPSSSAGFALMAVLFGPLGFSLIGTIAASTPGNVAVPFTPTPRLYPRAPAIEQRPMGGMK